MSEPHRSFEVEQFVLENGLRVLLVENHAVPSVSLYLSVLAGGRNDSEEFAGSAVMVSRLLDEGTGQRTSLEIADAIESVGGAIDCDCSYDRTSVFLGVLSKDIGLGLELVADITTDPLFSEDSLVNERQRTLTEIRSAMDRPQVVAGWEFNELVYGAHALHRPVHGYPETIERIRRSELTEFHRRHFVPNNAILSVVGDFDAASLRKQIESVFGEWMSRPLPTEPHPVPVRQSEIRRKLVAFDSQQTHVFFGHLGVERTHPDFYTLQVMDTILGSGAGLTARIPRKLRDEQGLAYTTFASITSSASLDPGKFLAYIGTSPENVERAIQGFVQEIDRIVAERVDAEELADAKAYLTGSFVFGFESNSQIARFLVNAELFDLGFDYVEKYPHYIEDVSADDVLKAAARHLSSKHYSLVIAGPDAT